ncbi:MAG TPA: peptidyl-alpha-hydroxyglycine alpha-amidating lyase family protein [Vicinamibacterales bacterium]|nr:peptidyl-alpha-hydroxyglycine alpha-amidating lyase family protein [Vicinamibacterales bacterium]
MMPRLSTSVVVSLLLCAGPALVQGQGGASAPAKAKATTPEIPFDSVPNFFKLPAGLYMGEGVGVATNSKGHVFVYTRSGETRLFEFDQTGAFVKEIGAGSYGVSFAHAVRVDKDDNVWAVDEGSNVIMKFNPEGKMLMVLGKRPDPLEQLSLMPGGGQYSGANKPYSFHRETDVAWDPQGNIFVSDGYGDSRVVKYDRNGRFIKSVGTRGSGPMQFNTPHAIAVDAKGLVYVADRGNSRIHVLDNDLNPKAMYDNVGAPWAICISQGPHQYLYSSNSFPTGNDWRQAPTTGEVYKMELDGTVLGRFGKAGRALKEFSSIHQMDCRNPDEIYVAEITAWRVQKILLHSPVRSTGGKQGQP